MLRVRVKDHISQLSDAALVQYVLIGTRMYDPDAIAFAIQELDRRQLSPEVKSAIRQPLIDKLIRYDATHPETVIPSSSQAIVCRRRGFEAPTKYTEYHENIGAIFFRFSTIYRGSFCKNCNRKVFWKATLVTLFLGWWGFISFFVTLYALIENALGLFRSFSLQPVPPGAGPPQLDESNIPKLAPHLELIYDRLLTTDPSDIAREVGPLAGVSPVQAWCFIQLVIKEKLMSVQAPTFGFPVVMRRNEE